MIIHSIVNGEDKYVLDDRYVRWGKVEQDLFALDKLASQQAVASDRKKEAAVDLSVGRLNDEDIEN